MTKTFLEISMLAFCGVFLLLLYCFFITGCEHRHQFKLSTGKIITCKKVDVLPCGAYLRECDDGITRSCFQHLEEM